MPLNEIIGFLIGALIIGAILLLVLRPSASVKRRSEGPHWFGGLLETSLRAYREDQLRGDTHLPRYHQARARMAAFWLAIVAIVLALALLNEFWMADDIPRPSPP